MTVTIAGLSSLFLALMILFDRIMLLDCYEGRTNHAWFVSTAFGAFLGLVATSFGWLILNTANIAALAGTLLWPYGLWVALAGFLSGWYLYHYFKCFVETDNVVLASWFAALPAFIFIALAFTNLLVSNEIPLFVNIPIADVRLDIVAFVSITIISLGLFLLEYFSESGRESTRKYIWHLAVVMILNILYPIITDRAVAAAILSASASGAEIAMSLLPYFWLAFALNGLVILKRGEWASWRRNFSNVRRFALPIIIMEVFGMLFFYFEVLGLGIGDPSFVEIIIGLHALIVLGAGIFIFAWAKTKSESGAQHYNFLRTNIRLTHLREGFRPSGNHVLQSLAILCIIVGLSLWTAPL